MQQRNEYLTHMAALVRENPNITVKEIAQKLQFADGKSVYYWLEKGDFRGIGEFKQRVFAEQKEVPLGYRVVQNGKPLYLLTLPIKSWTNQKEDEEGWYYTLSESPNPRGLFALTIETNSFYPWFSRHDRLIIDTKDLLAGPWVLVRIRKGYQILKRGPKNTLLDPRTLEEVALEGVEVIGRVVSQQRMFS